MKAKQKPGRAPAKAGVGNLFLRLAKDDSALQAVEAPIHVRFQLIDRHRFRRDRHHSIVGSAIPMPGRQAWKRGEFRRTP